MLNYNVYCKLFILLEQKALFLIDTRPQLYKAVHCTFINNVQKYDGVEKIFQQD